MCWRVFSLLFFCPLGLGASVSAARLRPRQLALPASPPLRASKASSPPPPLSKLKHLLLLLDFVEKVALLLLQLVVLFLSFAVCREAVVQEGDVSFASFGWVGAALLVVRAGRGFAFSLPRFFLPRCSPSPAAVPRSLPLPARLRVAGTPFLVLYDCSETHLPSP